MPTRNKIIGSITNSSGSRNDMLRSISGNGNGLNEILLELLSGGGRGKTRNQLLTEIVVANGGTVTNPNNRNQLLKDWLSAINGGSSRWMYDFDGIDDYISLNISLAAGEKISVTFSNADFSISRPFFSSTPNTIAVDGGGNFYSSNNGVDYTAELDGNVIGNFSPAPTDGGEYTLTITAINPIVIDGFGILNGGIRFFDGIAKGIIVNDGSVYTYPVNDGWSNNPVIANSGSGPDAVLINGQEEGWIRDV